LLIFFTMTEFWDKPAEKSGKVLAAFLEGQPLIQSTKEMEPKVHCVHISRENDHGTRRDDIM
jgi:hypothetical protein